MTANSGSAGKNELITIIFDRVSWPVFSVTPFKIDQNKK